MAGANYMGGRRNAAKARSRDKTGRIQKDFFGRRRLNILSKGLAAAPRSRDPTSGGSVSAIRAAIELGHAKSVITPQQKPRSVVGKHDHDCLDINIRTSSSPSKRSAQTGSSSIKSTKSKLLQELDFIEPHAAMSCILAMNDLAGLRPSPDRRMHLDSSQRSPSPVSNCNSGSVLDEEEDPIMEYESVSGSCYQSSISTSGSEDASSYHNTRRSDDWFQQNGLESEYMRNVDFDQDGPSHCPSSSKVFGCAQASKPRRNSSVSLLAPLSRASREDGSSSFLYVSNSRGRFAHLSSRSDGKMDFVGNFLSPECSNASTQLIYPNIGAQMGGIYPNILDYSDPWEQIGVIMGLQADHASLLEDNQMLFTSQEERNTAENEPGTEKKALLESDLPPSDVMGESSLDDTLYSPSSLPIAESSESIGPCLDTAGALSRVGPDGIWEVDFDDWAAGLQQSQRDDTAASSTHDIFVADGSASNESVVIKCGDTQGRHPFYLEGQQHPVKEVQDSDAAGSHPPAVEDARSFLAEGFLMQSPLDAMGKERCAVECAVQSEDVLTVPRLLECNGVYQGPCLLSQGSELDE